MKRNLWKTSLMLSILVLCAVVFGRENIIVCQAHPDDLEGCLGLVIKAKERFDLHVVTYTGGEGGIPGRSAEETRSIRHAEDTAVAEALGATLHAIGQIDGSACASEDAVAKLVKLFGDLTPRAVFVHFPVDLHPDHVMCYAATWKAWLLSKPRPEIYFFEEGGIGQTHNFHPQHYLDISDVWEEKKRLMRLWKSQNEDDFLVKFKTPESLLRGAQMIWPKKYAEAYEGLVGLPESGPTIFQDLADVRWLPASWCSIGTSITWLDAHPESMRRGYQSRVMDTLHFTNHVNAAIDGGCVHSHLASDVKIPFCDLYTIEHGINDWGHCTPVGKLSDYVDSTSTHTFFGNYRRLVEKVRAVNPKAKFVLCTPRKGYGFNGYLPPHSYEPNRGVYLNEYADAVRAIAACEGFPVADFYAKCGEDHELASLSYDKALHPNDIGFARMAQELVPAILQAFRQE